MNISCDIVEEALKHLWDYSYLGAHPLANALRPQAHDASSDRLYHRDKGKHLSALIQQAIDQLKVDGPQRTLSRERRYYEILYGIYVEDKKNAQVATSLNISARTLYRERHKALDTLTRIVNELISSDGLT